MKISKKEVEYVARLARLELNEEEKEKYTGQIEAILEYIDQLNQLDTKNIPPTSHVLPLCNVWREDDLVISDNDLREKLLNNAPEREGDFYKVKKVLE